MPSDASTSTHGSLGFPRRFGLRLSATIVAVVTLATAVLAVGSFVVAAEYRRGQARERASDTAQRAAVFVAALPRPIEPRFQSLSDAVHPAELVVSPIGEPILRSSSRLGLDDVPGGAGAGTVGEFVVRATVDGRPYYVAGGDNEVDDRLFVFFPLAEVESGIKDFGEVLLISWIVVAALGAAVGHVVARRTLRPVEEAAAEARRMSASLLDVDLAEAKADDELSSWAEQFNLLAVALRSKLDELERARQRERRFIGDAAHDLLTPLSSLLTEAALLEDRLQDAPADVRRLAELVARDTRRATRLAEELLDLARLEAAQIECADEELDLDEVVQEAAEGRAAIEWQVDGHVSVDAERGCLLRILLNLIENAEVHGRPPVVLRVAQADDSVTITVEDHGDGVPETELDLVFDRFYKRDAARSGRGSGLGLSIAREAARVIGATVVAGRADHGGARFTVVVPGERVHEAVRT